MSESWDGKAAQSPLTDTLVFLAAVSSRRHHCGPAGFPDQLGLPICQGSLLRLLCVPQWSVPAGLGLCDCHLPHSPGQPPAHVQVAPRDRGPAEDHPLLQ